MSAYLEGLRTGDQMAQGGFDEFRRAKEWQARLAEGAAMRAEKVASAQAAREKQRFEEHEAGVKADQAAGKQSYDEQLGKAKLAEEVRHNKAMEAVYGDRTDKMGGGRGGSIASKVMTPAQATAAIREIQMRYPRKAGQDLPELGEADFLRVEELKAIQTPGYKPQPFAGPQPSWWQKAGKALLGGAPAQSELSPGARAAMGL